MIEPVVDTDVIEQDGDFVAFVETKAGRIYQYPITFRYETQAQSFLGAVRSAGFISPSKWMHYRTLYGTHAWIQDGCEEQEMAREQIDG